MANVNPPPNRALIFGLDGFLCSKDEASGFARACQTSEGALLQPQTDGKNMGVS
jgi:hypothetical protein